MTTFDWGMLKQRAAAGGAVPEDDYVIVLTQAKAHTSKAGNPGLKLRFKIAEGPYEGALIFHNMTILPEYPGLMAKFFEELEAMGIAADSLYGDADLDTIAERLEESLPEVQAKIKTDEYNGRKSNKIDGTMRPHYGSAPGAPSFVVAPPAPIAAPPVQGPDDLPF